MTPRPTQLPVIILAFANDDGRSLRHLDEEQKELRQIFQQAEKEGKCKILVLPAATVQDVVQAFQEYRNQVVIFHYGGHTDEDELFFRPIYPQQNPVKADHLAEFFALQEGLQLIFLNSCLSLQQAEQYSSGGVKTILATNDTIGDFAARNFAKLFYAAITSGADIHKAFQEAEKSFQLQFDEVYRGIQFNPSAGQFPWKLYPDAPAIWRLPLVAQSLTSIPRLHLEKEVIGRAEELEQLKKALAQSNKGLLINGLGGIGKTVLATAYVQQYGHEYDHLAWISQVDQQLISAIALNIELADTLGVPIEKEEENLNDRFQRILWKMRQLPGENLLVIDNAQDEVGSKEVYEQLPSGTNWKVLLTSRHELNGFERLRLDTLNPEDALALFCSFYKEVYDEQELKALLQEIGHHTLSIELFAKLLNKSSSYLSLNKLLELVQQHKLKEVQLQEPIWTQHSKEERSILLHLTEAFKVSKLDKDEIWLLKQLAVLPANNLTTAQLGMLLSDHLEYRFIEERLLKMKKSGKLITYLLNRLKKIIPEIIVIGVLERMGLLSGYNKLDSLSKLNRDLLALTANGWLISNDKNGYLIHRIVQQVVRFQLNITYSDLESLVAGLMGVLWGHPSVNPLNHTLPWIPHAEAVSSFLERENSFSLEWVRKLLAKFYLHRLNDYGRAKELTEWVLKHKKRTDTYSEMMDLANIYIKLGDQPKGLEIALSAYQKRIKKHGLNQYLGLQKKLRLNRLVASKKRLASVTTSDLAWIYYQIGDYKKSLFFFESVYDDFTHYIDDDALMNNFKQKLALVYDVVGELQKSKDLLENVLEYEQRTYSKDHPDLGVNYANLGYTYMNLGKHQEASILFDKAITIMVINYGPEHPKLQNLNNFASLNKVKLAESK